MPLIVRYPGHVTKASVCDRFAMNLDFAQTILDYGGLQPQPGMQGSSLRPLLEGTTPARWRTSVYYHYYEDVPPHHVAPHYGVRTDRYKLIRFYDAVSCWELYDLKADPHELHNLNDDPKYADAKSALVRELARLRREYGDHDGPEVGG